LDIALFLLVVGTGLLLVGADWFVDGAGDLACALGISGLVLGVLLVGLEPEEMLTAAIASARGAPALALGNVIGTNVTIVTLALGLSALLFPLVIDRHVRRQALIATLVSIIPTVLLLLGVVTQLEGVVFLVVFGCYTFILFRSDRETVKRLAEAEGDVDDDDLNDQVRPQLQWKQILLAGGGLVAMAVGGPALVEGALRLSHLIDLGQGVVGATIVSLGTGAEMIALGVTAARKKRSDILVGGILGSFAYNLLVTLGLAAAIHPIPVDVHVTYLALPVMIAVHLTLLALIWYGRIPRAMGGLLVAFYLAYLIAVVRV
jgi:cation:H+ antiporter